MVDNNPIPLTNVDQEKELISTMSLKGLSVLVVEDNVSNFVLMARMLGYLGIHCEWKTSGYEVVEFADSLPKLDLILMDIRLPYEDGYSALKKIQKSERLKQIPVVAITAEADPAQIEKAKAAGFNGFLGKPLNLDRFPDQMRKILSGISVWEL
ncbi:MAG: response regulator [Chloroflexi bacterium HGW-Chloroflexi-3]|nr:MAG: response regulator [Chloroflexi bacterium HGW-Chloroflexi-3]